MRKLLTSILLFTIFSSPFCQNIPNYTPNEILLKIKKLNVLGSVLYVAAHPDDENTVMLSWLAKEKLMRTSYLSITRGDGGQNLIGSEQSELLGLIRTHELLAAREIDGPEQYFTSASDFGFSKNTEETLRIWDEKAVLGDVVWRIRNLKPDVIICRFPPDARAGHGNHSASAVLAEKAFKVAADPNAYPEQLKYVEVWQAKRVVWNTFNFGGPSQKPDEKDYIKVEIGDFNPLLGQSYTEIAAESRSQHKSQGFGVPRRRGSAIEYFVHKDGEKAITDVFDGVDLSWKKVGKSWGISNQIDRMANNFKFDNPSNSLPELISIYKKIQNLEEGYWKIQKTKEIIELIKLCTGLFFEANASEYIIAQGEPIKLNFSIINRSNTEIQLAKIQLPELNIDTLMNNISLPNNNLKRFDFTRKIADKQPITQQYWLQKPKVSIGRYSTIFNNKEGEAVSEASYKGKIEATILGEKFNFDIPLVYKYTDEIRGELYRNFEVRPKITANFSENVYLVKPKTSKTIEINLKANTTNLEGTVSLNLPKGWSANPSEVSFKLINKLAERKISFEVSNNNGAENGIISAEVKIGENTYNQSITEINYDHIPPLVRYQIAEAKLVNSNIKMTAQNIGYINGAGDEVAKALIQMGCKVNYLNDVDLTGNLAQYDAIVVGIRAFNINDKLKINNQFLMKYVENGGNLVVQYQVNNFLQKLDGSLGPYPFKLSRDRVTVEEAEIRILKPNHPLLNYPNKINNADFEGWVQERGLYFSNEWDSKYETILSTNDPGDKPMDGGLLYAKYGKGNYIFTGYAFFRQLPAGVNGAYKLFANMVSNAH